MNDLFINENGQLRSGWRFVFFCSAFIVLTVLVTATVIGILQKSPIGFDADSLINQVLGHCVGLVIAIFLGWLCGKIFEDLPFRALGAWFTKFWFKDLILGCLLGLASITFAVLVAMAFGGLRFEFNAAAGMSAIYLTLAISFIIYFFGAAFEEVLFRGYIFQTLVRAKLAWLAILLTSAFFASVHLGNPNAGTFSTINTALAGIWLGVAYLKTRTLWLVFGIHLSWNWFLGSIYGIEVSGLTDLSPAPLFLEIDSGPSWITGGDYGIEGGISCTIALIISTIAIWYLPILKPTEEMLELTSGETGLADKKSESI